MINLEGWLEKGGIIVSSNSFVLISDFVVTTEETPLSIRGQIYTKAGILKVRLKIIDRSFNNSSSRIVILQKFILTGINVFSDGYNSIFFVNY